MADAEALARALGLEVVRAKIGERRTSRPPLRLSRAVLTRFSSLPAGVQQQDSHQYIGSWRRLPTMHLAREYVEAGGLMSYGSSFEDVFRRAGDYVDKILRGAKAGDLPVEQPTKFELVINRFTTNAVGLTVPDKLLAIADVVIE
jgi:putative ABC transport system substrate-binding protein